MSTFRPPADTFYFWGGPFSNFAAGPFLIEHPLTGKPASYPTVEHYFQACKATTLEEHERVRLAATAKESKRLGRTVALRPDWEEVKFEVMLTGLRAKFAVDRYRALLLDTGERYIAEDSPYDAVWGIRDRNGGYTGKNLLGQALMQIRAEIT